MEDLAGSLLKISQNRARPGLSWRSCFDLAREVRENPISSHPGKHNHFPWRGVSPDSAQTYLARNLPESGCEKLGVWAFVR